MKKLVFLLALMLCAGSAHAAACANITVTTTATTVFAANDLAQPWRIFSIQNSNPSGNDIWCAKGTATVNGGNYLFKGGGSWVETYPFPEDQITCITATGTTTVYACDYVPIAVPQ